MVQLQKQNPFCLYISIKSCKLFSISFEQTTSTTEIQILTKKKKFTITEWFGLKNILKII